MDSVSFANSLTQAVASWNIKLRSFLLCFIIIIFVCNLQSPILREGAKSVPKEKADAVAAGYTFLESFFHGQPYVAGNNLTIADFNIATTITQLNVLVPLASNRYPQVTKWLSLLQGHPTFAESNQEGLDIFDKFIKSKLS